MSDLQQRFVEEYLVDLNGTKAAIRAGYSEAGASTTAYRLLRNAEVQDSIDLGRKARGERTDITADRVLRELGKIAFADMTRVATWGPDGGVTYLESSDLEDDVAAAVSEVADKKTDSYDKDGSIRSTRHDIKVKLHDKTRALELIGKHLGMFKADEAQDQSQVLAKVLEVLASGGISIDQIVDHLSAKKPA